MTRTPELSPATYSVREAAQVLGVSAATIREAIYRGEIASFRVGSRILIPRRILDEMLQAGTGPGKEREGANDGSD